MNNLDDLKEIDDFVKNHKESDHIFSSISTRDLKNGNTIYKKLKDLQDTDYFIFGSSGWTSFGLYKSKEKIIYLIRVYVQTITDYTIIDLNNENYFNF